MPVKKVVKKTIKKETRVVSKTVKKTVAKPAARKVEKNAELKKEKVQAVVKAEIKEEIKQNGSLKINVLDTDGKAAGAITLPEAIFKAKINPKLMAQAVRVYLANQRQGNADTKTRGEVLLTKAKWYRQKGTGRARHGAKSAPIFVKGGVAHGPHPRDYSLTMPSKMKRASLLSALSSQLENSNVLVVTGIEKLEPKTKNIALTLEKLGIGSKTLIVMPEFIEKVYRAGRNIKHVEFSPVKDISTYQVLNSRKILFMKEAVEKI